MVCILHTLTPEGERPTLDIVAIHGLNGHYRDTWAEDKKIGRKTLWLKDLLPAKLPGCRVMSLQYDASINSLSTTTVRDTARKMFEALKDKREDFNDANIPIVFIGHSLGGIIIKQALALAREDFQEMVENTKGIVFFGTPHRGADAAHWALTVTKIAGAALRRPQSNLLTILQTNSDGLFRVSEDFRPIASQYAIVSFYEEYALPALGKVVVDKASSIMNLPHEQKLMLSGTHMSMCRFAKDDAQFDPVWRRIKRAAAGRSDI